MNEMKIGWAHFMRTLARLFIVVLIPLCITLFFAHSFKKNPSHQSDNNEITRIRDSPRGKVAGNDLLILSKAIGAPLPPGIRIVSRLDPYAHDDPCVQNFLVYQFMAENEAALKELLALGHLISDKSKFALAETERGLGVAIDGDLIEGRFNTQLKSKGIDSYSLLSKPGEVIRHVDEIHIYEYGANHLFILDDKLPREMYLYINSPSLDEVL